MPSGPPPHGPPPYLIRFLILGKLCGHLLDERLAPLGLTRTQSRVLGVLSHHGEMTATELLPFAAVEPASMTLLLQGLERDGHIQRAPHPTDGRASLLSLTVQGKQVQRNAATLFDGVGEDLFGGLTDVEDEMLNRLLERLWERLDQQGVVRWPPRPD